jgi:hypothetical protein
MGKITGMALTIKAILLPMASFQLNQLKQVSHTIRLFMKTRLLGMSTTEAATTHHLLLTKLFWTQVVRSSTSQSQSSKLGLQVWQVTQPSPVQMEYAILIVVHCVPQS